MKNISGLALAIIGLLHSLLALVMPGVVGFSRIWQEIINVGMIDADKPDSLRIWGYYWFLMPGFIMMLLGLLCHWIEHHIECRFTLFFGLGTVAGGWFWDSARSRYWVLARVTCRN